MKERTVYQKYFLESYYLKNFFVSILISSTEGWSNGFIFIEDAIKTTDIFHLKNSQMEFISWKGAFAAFKIICVTSAISMTIYCSYDYSKNEDLSVVSFKEFNENEENLYPQLELCVYDYSTEVEVANESRHEIDLNSLEKYNIFKSYFEQIFITLLVEWIFKLFE